MTTAPADSKDVQQALGQIGAAVKNGGMSSAGAGNLTSWLTKPAYGQYRDRLLALIRDQKFDELDGLFWEGIPFGTGGRRRRMGALRSATFTGLSAAEP